MGERFAIKLELKNEKEAEALLRGLMKTLPVQRPKVMKQFITEATKVFKERILAAKFDVKPLTEAYRRRKIAEGHSSKPLVRTQGYVDGLKPWVDGKGSIGIIPHGKDEETGIEYVKLAPLLERGTKTMLARPHWEPFGKWAARKLWPKYVRIWIREAYADALALAKSVKR